MHRLIAAISLLFILEACATQQDKAPPSYPASLYSERTGYGGSTATSANAAGGAHAGQWAVAIIGTPVYLAMKTVVCGASLVVAAPTAAVIALADSPYAMGVDKLGDGVATNCGPPYVLSPS